MTDKYVNLCRLILMSTAFLVLFTGYMTAQGLATKILNDASYGKLGFWSLGILFLTLGLSSIFLAPVALKCGDKWVMMLGSLCYAAYTGAFILPLILNENKNTDP